MASCKVGIVGRKLPLVMACADTLAAPTELVLSHENDDGEGESRKDKNNNNRNSDTHMSGADSMSFHTPIEEDTC